MKWKDYLYYQRGEQLAIIILLAMILLVLLLNILLQQRFSSDVVRVQNDSLINQFEEFQHSYEKQIALERESYTQNSYKKNNYSDNRWKKSSSTSSSYNNRYESPTQSSFPRQEKLATGEKISLNSTDTVQWKKIPGIGSSFASRIVKYQNRLGGFASIEQLKEVYGVDNEMFYRISPYIQVDENFKKIAINKLEFKELLSHPYLSYKQVQAIVNLRRRTGNIQSIDVLAMLDEFTSEDIERLRPYLEF